MTSATEPQSDELATVEQTVRELRRALSTTRWMRRLTLLLLISGGCAAIGILVSFYGRITSEPFLRQLRLEAESQLSDNDVFTDELHTLTGNITPRLHAATEAQIEQDLPRYAAEFGIQKQILLHELQPKLKGVINETYGDVLDRFVVTLAEEFPEARDPQVKQRIRDRLELTVQRLVETHYIQPLNTRMQYLDEQWETFPMAAVKPPDESRLFDELVRSLLQVSADKIVNGPQDH